jgi:WD40 repeat protein
MLGQPLTGHNDIVLSLEFSPDGRTLISHSLDETVIYWDIATRQIIDQLHKEAYQIYDRAYSLASKTYATISPSDYNNIILSDEAGQTIGLLAGTNRVTSVAFSPNGKTLASGSCYGKPASRDGCIQGEIILWDVNLQSWIEKSCQRVGRNFTLAEWEKYFPNEKYRATCPQFPLEPEVTVIPTTIP